MNFRVFFFDANGDSQIVTVRASDYMEARRIVREKHPGCDITHIDREDQ